MALYGINAYMSNSSYTSLLSGGMNSNRGYNSRKTSSTSDLYALMQRVDQVRSADYRKSMIEEYKKVFSGDEIGSGENEEKLSEVSSNLSKSAAALATANDFSDKESMIKNVETFVEDYNSTIDALTKSDSVDALKKGLYMTNTTKAYARALSRAGIKLGSDNKLTLNKDQLAEAYDTTLKSILSGNYSFASKVADKASDISKAAALKAQVAYNKEGNLDYFTRLSLNSMFSEKI